MSNAQTPPGSRLARWVFVSALACSTGCADLLDIPQSPVLIQDDPWLCDPAAEQPVSPKPDKAIVRVHACNFISSNCAMPVTGLTAKLCNKLDYACGTPIQSGIKDSNGDFMFEVPTQGTLGTGFDGFLYVSSQTELCTSEATCRLAPMCDPSAPDEKCKVPLYAAAALFFNPPIAHDVETPIALPLVPSVAGASLLMASGARRVDDQSLGIVFATALGCDHLPAAGVSFRSSPMPPTFGTVYQVNGVVVPGAVATDESGIGGLIGVPPAFVMISAWVSDAMAGGRQIGSSGIQVLPNSITYISLLPETRAK